MGLIFTAISPEFFSILVPAEYSHGYVVIPWLVGAAILHASASMTGIGTLLSEKTYTNTAAAWIGTIVNIVLTIVLIPIFGIGGAAIGTFVAELIFTVVLWYYSQKHTTIRFHLKFLAMIFVGYVVASCLILWLIGAIQNQLLSLAYRLVVLAVAIAMMSRGTIDPEARLAICSIASRLRARV